jgi:HK97 family phage portal protein
MPISADRARRVASRRSARGPITEQAYRLLNPLWTAPQTGTATPATESEALGFPPFGRGVEMLASSVAGTDWFAAKWQADNGVWQRLADQPLVVLDPSPAASDGPWQYKYETARDLIIYGNHFSEFLDMDARTYRPAALVPLHPSRVGIVISPDVGWYWVVDGIPRGAADLFHITAGAESDSIVGRGVLAQYKVSLGGQVAAENAAGGYFEGGGLPPAVINPSKQLTDSQTKNIKAAWRDLMTTREPVIMPQGWTLEPVVSSAVDQQLVEARTWNAQLAAMVLGIPAHMLGLQGPSMTYSNVETADIGWMRDTVSRWTNPIAGAFSKWLLPAGTELRWDYASRMRSDIKTTAEVVTGLVVARVLTVDEGRAMLGRPPMDDTTTEGSTPEGVPELTPQGATT